MTPEQIFLVQSTFAMLRPQVDALIATFYHRLFTADPTLRAMFPRDMAAQRRKLAAALGTAVQALSRPQAILPTLHELGRRHAAYGVRDAHYATVGAALLAALTEHLGDVFGSGTEAAWAAAYGLVATTMQAGARAAAA